MIIIGLLLILTSGDLYLKNKIKVRDDSFTIILLLKSEISTSTVPIVRKDDPFTDFQF